ncbi:HERV-H LTR-associating protein 1 [Oncorhynchus keta]|uniref:HERV-H LTR-associating protein 1 n=1 Tax=Oncorhynchus keta TaxID=8018 RepID=UPI0015FA4E26|nr:HERV-H LTR-associating protein 1 [Oncorhynchus keta]
MMAGFWASRNHSKLCLRTCVAILLLLVFFHIAQRHGNQEEIYKRDLLASTEIPAEYIDPTSIDLTPLVNTLIHSTQLGSSQLFSLLSVTSHSSLALHKLTLLVYNISNFRSIADNMFPRRYCYCVTNETNDLTDFTAILLDVMGNSTSYLQELFKSSSILSVSQNNISDCIYICVMAGKSDKYLSQLWEVDSIMPLFNQTITESAHKGNHSVNFDPSLTSRVHSTAHVSSTASEITSTAPPTTTSRTRTTSFLTSTRAQPTTTTPSPTTKTRTRTTGRPTSISVPTTTSRTTVLMTPTTALPITITAQPTITIAPPSTTTAQQSRSTALPTTTQSTTDRPTTSTALPTTAQPTTALPIPALLPTTTVLPTTTTAQPTTTTALRIMTTATPTAAQPIPISVQPTKVPSSTTTDQLTTTAQPTTTTPQLTTVQVTTTTTQLTTTTDQPTTAMLWPTTPTIRFRMTTTPVRLTMTTTPSTITAILITATKAQPTTDPPATGQAITTTQLFPTAQQTTTTTQLTTTTAPWTITNITTTATRVITKAPITEKPGCPWRRPGLTKIEERSDNSITSSTTTTVSAHKLQPCVLELCKFFSQCLCHSYSYKTHMKRYCADSHVWYEKHTFEVCRRVRRVSFSRNLKQRCLARMCNKLWPEWKRDKESGIY